MNITRHGQRMYPQPVAAPQGAFLPSPEGLFGTGTSSGKRSSNSGSKDSSKKDEAYKAMPIHSLRLQQEEAAVRMTHTRLQSIAYDKLSNEYKGDVEAFQEGEMKKYIEGKDDNNFYSIMSEGLALKGQHKTNIVLAEVEYDKWIKKSADIDANKANDQIIEDQHGYPIRWSPDGGIYNVSANENGAIIYRDQNSGKEIEKEVGDTLPMLTQEQYMQYVWQTNDFKGGKALGPGKYYDSFDTNQAYFQDELNTFLNAAASARNQSGGSSFQFVPSGGIPGSTAADVSRAWNFLAETQTVGYSNVNNLMAAVATVYNSVSEIARKDLRQEWYAAQRSGRAFISPKANPDNKDGYEAGNDLSLETFMYNRAVGGASVRMDQGVVSSTNLNMMDAYNKAPKEAEAPKEPRLGYMLNPERIVANGEGVIMDFYDKTPAFDKDGKAIYNRHEEYVAVSRISDPFMLQEINAQYVNPNKSGDEQYIYTVEQAIGSNKVLGLDGIYYDFKGTESKFAGFTEKLIVGPQYGLDESGEPTEKMLGYNQPEGVEAGKQTYMVGRIKVAHVKKFRRQNTRPEALSENKAIKTKTGSRYLEDIGAEYEGILNQDMFIEVMIPTGDLTNASGVGMRAPTTETGLMLKNLQERQVGNETFRSLVTPKK